MVHATTITLTQTELTSIVILASEFVRRELAGINKGDLYQTDHTRKIWVDTCKSILLKSNKAIAECERENQIDRVIAR